ncbi:RNA chaperone Hfq [Pseudomonas sp. NCHU5208]|uniref:RNA chaperone Hfq n=1 Tax=unclassified Pseudomonas TaxID=196821 RepID=UPI003F95908D
MTTEPPKVRPYTPQYDRSTNEQDRFLDYCQRNKCLVTVILESGLALQGMVVEHDRKALMLGPKRSNKDVRFIAKSYISLIRAEEILPLFLEYRGKGTHLTRKRGRREAAQARKDAEAGTGVVRQPRAAKPRAPKPAKPKSAPVPAGAADSKPAVKIVTKRRRRTDCEDSSDR